ncbi:MAG TPA: CPBP family intramembrane glutamic endopeptidase [Flavobacterium sp.]|jgi:hypothetical protein
MFIQQAYKPNNKIWKYIIGSLAVIIASSIGQIPLFLAIMVKNFSQEKPFPTNEKEIMTALEPNLTLFLMLFSFLFAIIAFYFIIRYLHQQPFTEVTTSRKKVDFKRIFFAFGIWAVFTIASTYVDYYFNTEDYIINFKPLPFLLLFVIAIVMIPIQTSMEEYIFRGYLMQGFGILSKNKWFPLLMTSLVFGGLHYFNPEVDKLGNIIMIYYIGTGLFLGIITLMDEGMELSLGFHAANNLVGALLVTADWTAFQTHSVLKDISEPTAGFEAVVPVLIIYPIILFIFSKKYNWYNWKERLTGEIKPMRTDILNEIPIQND